MDVCGCYECYGDGDDGGEWEKWDDRWSGLVDQAVGKWEGERRLWAAGMGWEVYDDGDEEDEEQEDFVLGEDAWEEESVAWTECASDWEDAKGQ